jgi:TonB family protein
MSRTAKSIGLSLLALLVTIYRLPAPVHEVDEKAPTTSEESAKPKIKHSKTKNDGDSKKAEAKSTSRPSGKAKNLDGPKPVYPTEAAGQQISGTGKYLLIFDQATGKVTDVTVTQSCGSALFDNAAVAAFRQWHEDPQCAKEVTMTMTFQPPAAPQE